MQWQIQNFEKAGRNLVRGGGADLLRGRERGRIMRGRILSVAQRLHTAAGRHGAGAGGGRLGHPGMLAPENFLICECPYVHFRVLKGHIF